MAEDALAEIAANAKVLADLLIDHKTNTHQTVKILNKLLEGREHDGFFEVMMQEKMSYAPCPECGHENHWLIPEDHLNKMGWVTGHKDPRVKINTTHEDCPQFQEACGKRKTNA